MKLSFRSLLCVVGCSLVLFLLPFVVNGVVTPIVDVSDLAYESINGRFLHVYEDNDDILGQFYGSDGSYAGSAFPICDNASQQRAPRVTYAATHQAFLVVWEDSRSDRDIYGQFVVADGDLLGTASTVNFPISEVAVSSQESPSVDFDPVTERFLVAWADRRNNSSLPDIYGQFVNTSPGYLFSTTSTQNFAIASSTGYGQHSPEVGYDSVHNLFLVAFMDYRDANHNIYGQFVDAANTADFLYSTAVGTNFPIGTTAFAKKNPSLAYDTDNGRYLVVWDQNLAELHFDIAGQIVDASDTVDFLYNTDDDENIVISDNIEDWQYGPRAAYDPDNNKFLVAWTDYRGGEIDIYGQVLAAGGTLRETSSSENFPLVASDTDDYDDAVATLVPNTGEILVVYNANDINWEAAVYNLPSGGGSGGGCNTVGSASGDPLWTDMVWIALLAGMFMVWRRKNNSSAKY